MFKPRSATDLLKHTAHNVLLLAAAMAMIGGCKDDTAKAPTPAPPPPATATNCLPFSPGTNYTFRNIQPPSSSVKSGEETIRAVKLMVGDVEMFGFAGGTQADKNSGELATSAFGMGLYQHRPDGLYTLPAKFTWDVKNLEPAPAVLLLPSDLSVGRSWEIPASGTGPKWSLQSMPREAVTVPAGEFRDCVRIHIRHDWPDGTKYESDVWMSPGLGVVKWVRTTGRIEELAKVVQADTATP